MRLRGTRSILLLTITAASQGSLHGITADSGQNTRAITHIRLRLTQIRLAFALALWCILLATHSCAGQRYPILSIGGPDAPKGCLLPFEDSHGRMWLAGCETASRTLSYFDGSRFFAPPLSTVGPAKGVSGMQEDSAGGIWIASTAGIYRDFGGQLETITHSAAQAGILRIAADTFLAPVQLKEPGIGLQTDLVRITRIRNQWSADTILQSAPYVQFSIDRTGAILFGCPGGYCELNRQAVLAWQPGRQLSVVTHRLQLAVSFAALDAVVHRDAQGCVWLRNADRAAVQCPGDKRPATLSAGLIDRGTPSVLEAGDGTIVIPSFSKLALGRPGRMRVITATQGYPSSGTAYLAGDDSLWLGGAEGIKVLPLHTQQEFWTEQDGLEGNTWAMARIAGRMYAIAGNSIRVLRDDDSRWDLVARVPGAGSLVEGPGHTLLVGSHSDGVVWMDTHGRLLGRSRPADIGRLAATPDGRIFAAAETVFRVVLRVHRIELAPASAVPVKGPFNDLAVDPKGALWAISDTELIYQAGDGWRTPAGIADALFNSLRSLTVDRQNNIWFGDGLSLLFWLDQSSSPVDHGAVSLGSVKANFLSSDRRGRLWIGTPAGVYVATTDAAKRGEWIKLDHESGFAALDANRHAFFEDQDGSIWFGEDNHIVHVHPPGDLVSPASAPRLFVSAFAVDGGAPAPAEADGSMRLKSARRLTIMLGTSQMDRRSSLRVRYRLVSEPGGWRSTRSLDLELGKLRWGRHILEAQAQLAGGPWSPVVSQTFTVELPVWLSWPMLLSYGASGSAIGLGAARWRKRRQLENALLLPDLSAWRMSALSPETENLLGTRIDGRYEVGHILSVGGFATVVRARDLKQDGRLCAVKIFRYEFGDRAWIRHRFEQEITALAQLSHPNIVRITGHGAIDTGAPYLVMEFIHGRSLREELDKGAIAPSRTGAFLRQIADALAALHQRTIYHRDLKPENLMIRADAEGRQQIVLIDFSIAIVKSRDQTFHGISRVAGTLDYMAPEQVIGFADASTDIYSLAKIVIEMLTGLRWTELFPEAALDTPQQIETYFAGNAGVLTQDSIKQIVAAMAFDPARRPKDVQAFARPIVRDLEQLV